MKAKWIIGLIIILGASFFKGEKVDPAAEIEIIEKVVYYSIGWAIEKDWDLLFSIIAQDENFFSFGPDSASGPMIGFEDFKIRGRRLWGDSRFKATGLEIRDLRVTLSQSGTVAWYSCYLDDLCEWDGHKTGWFNIRWTGVVEKRDGQWVHTQQHFSFPTDRNSGS